MSRISHMSIASRIRRLPFATRAALVLLTLGALSYFFMSGSDDAQTHAYSFIAPTRGAIEETVTAQGKLEPKEFVDVGAQISGQLLKLHKEIGDTVKKGELIAEIDPKIYTAQVAADEARLKTLHAGLAEQNAQVAFTQSVYNRNARLMKDDAVSRETLDASLKEYKAAQARAASYKAQIEEATSQLEANTANLGYTKIYAPIDGTIVSQTSKEGQTLNANQTAPVIVQVADLDTMTVRAQVAEADISRLKAGMPVYFTTLGSERRWESTLRQLLPSPDATVVDVVLYNALVDVENTDRSLLTGMSTQMFFLLGRDEQALLIPAQALGKKLPRTEGAKGEPYEVMVETPKGPVSRTVEIGLMNRTQAQVLSGLSENERVAIASGTATATGDAARRMPRI